MNSRVQHKLAAIQEVQRATEAAMRRVIVYIRTEKAPQAHTARRIILEELRRWQCECPEGVIVAGGKDSAQPHAIGRGILKQGEPIVIDIFPRSKKTKYFADMTRTVCLGKPSKKLAAMHKAVLGAQRLAYSMVRPGVKGKDIQAAVERYFERKGFGRIAPRAKGKKGWLGKEGFIHGVGHGVGMRIHERPRVSHSRDTLKEGDVITIEPGLYYKDTGGVRIEDMVLVTRTGCRSLTKFSKQLTA